MKLIKCLMVAGVTLFAAFTQAQELKKAVLAVEKFTYSSSFSQADVEMVRNQIVNVIQKTGRVIVADHNSSTNQALTAESERRKQESAMDANTVADMVSLNANSILTVHLDQLIVKREIYEETENRKNGDKMETVVIGRHPYYKGTITYTVKITDCQNGSVQCQETFRLSHGSYDRYSHSAQYKSPEEAHQGIMNHCVNQDQFTILILNTFKAQGKVLQVEKGDAKKAKTVYISLGSEDGIAVKQILEVYKEFDLAGEVTTKLIGEVEVVELLGGTRCLAKVKKGGDVIQQTLAAGGNLPVKSRNVTQKFFGGVK